MASPLEACAAANQTLVIVCCVDAVNRPGTCLRAGIEAMVSKKVWLVR